MPLSGCLKDVPLINPLRFPKSTWLAPAETKCKLFGIRWISDLKKNLKICCQVKRITLQKWETVTDLYFERRRIPYIFLTTYSSKSILLFYKFSNLKITINSLSSKNTLELSHQNYGKVTPHLAFRLLILLCSMEPWNFPSNEFF